MDFPPEKLAQIPAGKREGLLGVLANDPRPRYQKDPERVYTLSFAGYEVSFAVRESTLSVTDVRPSGERA